MAKRKEVFIGSFPKMGTTNFRGLFQTTPKVKKTNITKFKGKKTNVIKKNKSKRQSK